MDVLQAEIARKRKVAEEAVGALEGKKKWVKKGDLEKLRVAKYLEEEAAARAKSDQQQEERIETVAGSDGPSSLGLGARAEQTEAASISHAMMLKNKQMRPLEVKRLLRSLGQPIQLFGETGEERLERYHAISAALPTENEDDLVLKNLEHGIADRQLFDESGKSKLESGAAKAGGGNDDKDEFGEEELAATFVPATPEQNVSRFFKQLIKLWEEELGARPEAETLSAEGKKQVGNYQQCRRHMKPSFKQLKHRTMPLDVLNTMIEITLNMQQREYVKAHDAYIRCAIGNAPWPMGISGTGVHERQGRQHIRESAIAHVMNDETQRKYLQSVKRLMTFAQRVLPGDGPSKHVS